MIYLGIDGGGTKTVFTLMDDCGHILASIKTDSLYYLLLGYSGVIDTLKKGLSELLELSNRPITDISSACIGLPGFGEILSDIEPLTHAIRSAIPIESIIFCNDVTLGWAGSLKCMPGINVVAGTGSIAYGVDDSGKSDRSGGWGYQVGGDEGSAHWIGSKIIQAFTKQADGRHEKTLLYHYLRQALSLQEDFDILDIALIQLKLERREIAKFALHAFELAKQGDPVALAIYEEAAQELFLTVYALTKKLNFKTPFKVSYSGGVFKSKDFVLKPFSHLISDIGGEIVHPAYEPAIGACLLAYQAVHQEISEKILYGLDLEGSTSSQ